MAEGLIPFIYRAIKRRRRREQTFSRSLSTGSQRWFGLPSHHHHHHKLLHPPAIKLGSFSEGSAGQGATVRHRRHRSMEDFSAAVEISSPEGGRLEKETVRFGSGRRVFSCITGAN